MDGGTLSDVHRAYLNGSAISDEVIEAQGVRSEGDVIVFTWRNGSQVTEQRRLWPEPPEGLPLDDDGKPIKYPWVAGKTTHFNIAREPGARSAVLLCEGTKQHLAVASWAPPEYAVYGMVGCRGWATENLARFKDRQVIILLDADAATNPNVYEAGEKLAGKLEVLGAHPFFARSPATGGSEGIDDFLASLTGDAIEDQRRSVLRHMVSTATAGKGVTRPAARKPAAKRKPTDQVPDSGSLPQVVVNKQRRDVIHAILAAMRQHWNASELFCYGGVITRLRDGRTEPLDRGAFLRWLSEGIACYRYTPPNASSPGRYDDAWPDKETIEAVMASADEFAPLNRVAAMPFFGEDGMVRAKNGYDTDTKTFLALGNSGMDRLDIPDHPSQDDAKAAAAWLLREWLGDMPFRDDASKANALALVLTPFIRGLVPLVPMAVISGLQIGVGKNLLADCLSIIMTGKPSAPLQWIPDDDDEVRKQLLSAFRQGDGLICFDEAHVIGGAALTRALTAQTYTDRILGVSQMAQFPNQATWVALGNQVQVNADMSRRVYFIELHPLGPNPQDRPESAFTHPDLRGWTAGSRPELVTALLIMLRAWFAAGCPAYPRGSLMGSFEAWDKMISGVLGYAEVPGFLGDLALRRAEADFTGGYWAEHIAWSARVFGINTPYTVIQVKTAAFASASAWCALPGLDNLNDPGFGRKLGQEYARHQGQWSGRFRLLKVGKGFNNVIKWMIEEISEQTLPDLGEGQQRGNENTKNESRVQGEQGQQGNVSSLHAHARTISTEIQEKISIKGAGGVPLSPLSPLTLSIDLETADASSLFTYTQRDETGFVRLAGAIGPAGAPLTMTGPELLPLLDAATVIEGHNVMAFDLLALAWYHGADYTRLAARARDTELIARQADPPRSRDTHSADSYDLDTVAQRLGVAGKTDDLGQLKRKFGGYDQIPLDDPEYRAYLEGDLRATAAVSAAQRGRYPADPYVDREHRLAAIAGRMSLNGFLVDRELLAQRLAEGQERKRECLQILHDGWGLPLTKTVLRGRGKNKTETEEEITSPLSTDAGRAWLEKFWEDHGLADPPRTAKARKLSIGVDDLKAIEVRRPDLAAVCRLMAIVTGTRTVYQTADKYLASDGRVHSQVSFRQASGRWSVVNPGMTVFGKRGGKHIERDIFLPDPGHVLVSFDLSQVDMRAMAGHSQDPNYMALFAPGRDAHQEIADQVGLDRQSAKKIGHGWNYGLGAKGMIEGPDHLDPGKVAAFISGMEQRFPVLIEWRNQVRERGKAGEILDNGFGRRMRCDPQRAFTVAPALMGQGGARDIFCECLLRMPRELDSYLRTAVHDELLFSLPKADAEEAAAEIRKAMTWEWRNVPITCDMSAGLTWGAASSH